jgi:hypothetical protein
MIWLKIAHLALNIKRSLTITCFPEIQDALLVVSRRFTMFCWLFPGDSRCFVGCFLEIHDVLLDYNVFPKRITCCMCSTKTFPILKVYHLFFEDTSFCHDSLTNCFLKMSQCFQPRNESIT